jgi:hypothetical protein
LKLVKVASCPPSPILKACSTCNQATRHHRRRSTSWIGGSGVVDQ